jgi:hypothetical protein
VLASRVVNFLPLPGGPGIAWADTVLSPHEHL